MTLKSDDVIKLIRLSVPGDNANATDTAKLIFEAAVLKVGKMRNVDYNREWKTFNFVSSKAKLKIGSDIMATEGDILSAGVFTYTDNTQPIFMLDIHRYRSLTGGLTASGRPTHATIHSATKTLEVYPTPDSGYEAGLYVRKAITSFKDIPEAYHSAVLSTGLTMVKALSDPMLADRLRREDMLDMQGDSMLSWNGSNVSADRGLYQGGRNVATSYNLRKS